MCIGKEDHNISVESTQVTRRMKQKEKKGLKFLELKEL
jgi:hypothetical protein